MPLEKIKIYIFLYKNLGVGIDFNQLNDETPDNYKISICFGFVWLNIILYFFGAMYFDQVYFLFFINNLKIIKILKNEFGARKSPLFFLEYFFKREKTPIKPTTSYKNEVTL